MDQIVAMRAFVTAGDTLSFTDAALRLRTTPQAVAKAVAQLEAQFGTRLLHRTTRRMSLTEAGHSYLQRAAGLLEVWTGVQKEPR